MRDIILTNAYIQKKEVSNNINLNFSSSSKKNLKKYPYLLVIQSIQEDNIRLTIYPVKIKNLIKVSLCGLKISDEVNMIYLSLVKTLQNFEIIHTSGLLIKENKLYFECYLNLSLSDVKTRVLKAALNKIKNIFKDIRIEEIGLK
ncbi:MAG: hypothetical protein EU540_07160 [Promethearchaeota archaeon]|nr:MAG: hypothetical protein EU540_07160 [Candidatus Lokiarchaeota archaeon]